MLETIAKGFKAAKQQLVGDAVTEQAIDAAVRDIRMSLLEADVDLGVTKSFVARVSQRAKSEVVAGVAKMKVSGQEQEITPYHRFVAICQDELEALMGREPPTLTYAPMGVTAIMMVGLQGAGKTTTSAKLARHLEREGKRTLLVAADVQRPAAVEQLQKLGSQIDVPVFAQHGGEPLQLCGDALALAGKQKRDVVIFDTAGRLAIDDVLMGELQRIKERTKPQEILLVVDAMVGQDAVRTAQAFDDALGITGFIMTKLDGDARGGAALSIKEITKRPIKFLGMGEGLDALERFRADGLASRILGMGDVVGLVEEFERHVDQDKAEADAERMFRGQFDLSDFVEQIDVLKKMGSLSDLFEKMPMFQEGLPEGARPDEREFTKIRAVHDSMTPKERRRPAILKEKSRQARVAKGAGRSEREVEEVLTKFDTMRRMMIALGDQPSLLSKMPGFSQIAQVRKLRGLDLAELFGDAFELPPEDDDLPEPSAAGPTQREYFSNLSGPAAGKKSNKDQKKKKKRQEAKARKKNRR